jgi:hypothetical protein
MPETKDLESILAEFLDKDEPFFRIEPFARTFRQRCKKISELLPELSRLAKIPPTGYEGFYLAMLRRVCDKELYFNDVALLSSIHNDPLSQVEERLRRAQNTIKALSHHQRHEIQMQVLLAMPDDEMKKWDTWIPLILEAIGKLPGRRSRSGPGRPALATNLQLHRLIEDLSRIALDYGGKFTVYRDDENRARGAIVDALGLLRTVLGSEIVRDELQYSTVRDLLRPRKRARKTRR